MGIAELFSEHVSILEPGGGRGCEGSVGEPDGSRAVELEKKEVDLALVRQALGGHVGAKGLQKIGDSHLSIQSERERKCSRRVGTKGSGEVVVTS